MRNGFPPIGNDISYPPNEFIYQRSAFPFQVHEQILRINEDGTSKEIVSGHSSWPEDLVMAMANSGDYSLYQAIFVASEACSRCLNALYFKYIGGGEGLAEDSCEYQSCNTRCDWCRGQ